MMIMKKKNILIYWHAATRKWWRISKKGKRLKVLTQIKPLTRLPMLLAQIKAGNNPYKFKNKIRQTLHLLYQHNKITKKI